MARELIMWLVQHPTLFWAFIILMIASMWRVFSKADVAGWKCLIPIYAQCKIAEIAGKPWWGGLLLFVPGLNILASLVINFGLARKFGKSLLFGVGLTVMGPVFVPMLAFGDARYRRFLPD